MRTMRGQGMLRCVKFRAFPATGAFGSTSIKTRPSKGVKECLRQFLLTLSVLLGKLTADSMKACDKSAERP
jgi:hypothetical protein